MVQRRLIDARTSTGEQHWDIFNGHLRAIAAANVTGHAGDINELTRAEINSFGGQIHYHGSNGDNGAQN
jgi:hypothetical protein